jgi:Tfp pilus assembly protein PilO
MNPVETTQLFGLVRRHVFSSVCSCLSLILLAAIWVLRQDLHAREIENRERSQEFAAMLSTLRSGPLIRQELARAQQTVQRIENNLVIEKNLAENLWYFYKIDPESKDILTTCRPLNPETSAEGSEYKLVPFSLLLTGTYEQVAGYLLQLETGPRLGVIRSFSFRRQQQGAPGLTLYLEVRMLGRK